jgi:hypothetical protein
VDFHLSHYDLAPPFFPPLSYEKLIIATAMFVLGLRLKESGKLVLLEGKSLRCGFGERRSGSRWDPPRVASAWMI